MTKRRGVATVGSSEAQVATEVLYEETSGSDRRKKSPN